MHSPLRCRGSCSHAAFPFLVPGPTQQAGGQQPRATGASGPALFAALAASGELLNEGVTVGWTPGSDGRSWEQLQPDTGLCGGAVSLISCCRYLKPVTYKLSEEDEMQGVS